ncbi:MAG: 3'-5' exoribonuclease [Candidatus Obscuribacterales bacterium]|nr:3'-5' exoribonuclease [Candidatus Obscuribacterales bacterium]
MDVFVSCDVETTGPIPNPYSMLQLGVAAFTSDAKLVSTFNANLAELEPVTRHPDTMSWWDKQPGLFEATRKDMEPPEEAMLRFDAWLLELPGPLTFVAYPAGFDFTFVYWYLVRFTGMSRFSHSALDIKTLAMAAMKVSYRKATKRHMPKSWFSDSRHTHVAVEDAIEQGELFFAILESLDLKLPD